MPTITATVQFIFTTPPVVQVSWLGLTSSGDVGNLISYPGIADKTVQFVGASGNTFGASLTVVMRGGMVNSIGVASTLRDALGANISTSSLQTFAILENPRYFAPEVTYGASGLALDVIVIGTAPLY